MSVPEVELELGRKLGKGAFSKVYKGKVHGMNVALKMYHKGGDEEAMTDELEIFTLLGDHPNILEHGPRIDPRIPALIKTPTKLYLTLKYYDMTLHDYIWRLNKPMAPDLIYSYTSQLLKAVAHCHSLNIAHNDVRPQNILIDWKGKLVLADFNISAVDGEFGGCLWYKAPEHFLCKTTQRRKFPFGLSDMWSVGTTLAEMTHRRAIFPGDSEQDMLTRICRQIGPPTEENCPTYSKSKLWNQELSSLKRRKIEDIVDHDGLNPWFYELCNSMLAYPLERISTVEALARLPHS